MSFIEFLKQIKTTTTGLMAMGIISTVALCASYRFVFKPEMDKRRRLEAEAYANYIFEREMKQAQDTKF